LRTRTVVFARESVALPTGEDGPTWAFVSLSGGWESATFFR